MQDPEVIIVGGGFAGLSAAIYLGRAQRETVLIDAGKSIGLWEPHVENYLGFTESISGGDLLAKGRQQAERFGVKFVSDHVNKLEKKGNEFEIQCNSGRVFRSCRVLLATGLLHIPPDIPGVKECLGHSMFFCKDCDGLRVQDQHIAILGWNNDAVEYALGLLYYSPCIYICTNGHEPDWDPQHASWLAEYKIPVFHDRISDVGHHDGTVHSLQLAGGDKIAVQAIFTTRGDIFYNQLGKQLGVELDEEGQIKVDHKCRTSVPGLYAAGCVTPANCQMIIAAGQGATAAQAINRDLFEESLEKHKLRLMRNQQLDRRETEPAVLSDSDKP